MILRLTLSLALALIAATGPRPAAACEIALVLAMDVSGSVDSWEYRLQADGLAASLRDPEVGEALLQGRVALTLVQWSGSGQQSVSLPWARMHDTGAILAFAARVERMPRAFDMGSTAVGEAITFSAARFAAVPDCAEWVIDVSGDGDENAGFTLPGARRAAVQAGIRINGLAIEGLGTGMSITRFYQSRVITPGGFVETAHLHRDFARAMRRKLLRELVTPLAGQPHRATPLAWAGVAR